MACSYHTDQYGTSYTVQHAEPVKTPKGRTLQGFPAIDVWWSRTAKDHAEETLIIRQEYSDRTTADVIEMTFAQLYDLINALNHAVEDM